MGGERDKEHGQNHGEGPCTGTTDRASWKGRLNENWKPASRRPRKEDLGDKAVNGN